MKIGILGAGKVGGNLGKVWAKRGHKVMFSSRNPESVSIRSLAFATGAEVGTAQQALDFGEVVVIALPWNELPNTLKSLSGWNNKVVIDATNRFGAPPADSTGSSSQDIARWTKANIVKCFNSLGAEHFVNPVFEGQQASMFYCGDDPAAKQVVHQLVADIGFEPFDVGGLDKGDLLTSLTMLWFSLTSGAYGRNVAFKVIHR